MKYRNRIWIVFVLVMLAALAILVVLTEKKSGGRRDMVAYNDELHRIYADYREGRPVAELEEKYGCEIVLASESDAQVVKAYAEYGLVMDFAPDGEAIGKILWSDVKGRQEESQQQIRRTALIVWGVFLAAGLAFLLALEYYLLRPMREMRGVAGEIAKGNLDVPLPIRKHNPFGNLAEGFDLMREELRASKEREAESEKAKKEM